TFPSKPWTIPCSSRRRTESVSTTGKSGFCWAGACPARTRANATQPSAAMVCRSMEATLWYVDGRRPARAGPAAVCRVASGARRCALAREADVCQAYGKNSVEPDVVRSDGHESEGRGIDEREHDQQGVD